MTWLVRDFLTCRWLLNLLVRCPVPPNEAWHGGVSRFIARSGEASEPLLLVVTKAKAFRKTRFESRSSPHGFYKRFPHYFLSYPGQSKVRNEVASISDSGTVVSGGGFQAKWCKCKFYCNCIQARYLAGILKQRSGSKLWGCWRFVLKYNPQPPPPPKKKSSWQFLVKNDCFPAFSRWLSSQPHTESSKAVISAQDDLCILKIECAVDRSILHHWFSVPSYAMGVNHYRHFTWCQLSMCKFWPLGLYGRQSTYSVNRRLTGLKSQGSTTRSSSTPSLHIPKFCHGPYLPTWMLKVPFNLLPQSLAPCVSCHYEQGLCYFG